MLSYYYRRFEQFFLSSPACPAGTYGSGCQHACTCLHHGECDPVTGTCSCRPGYHGDRCQFVCPAGQYGRHCEEQCLCQNGAPCRKSDGFCSCPPGFMGTYCGESKYPHINIKVLATFGYFHPIRTIYLQRIIF